MKTFTVELKAIENKDKSSCQGCCLLDSDCGKNFGIDCLTVDKDGNVVESFILKVVSVKEV